MAGKAKVENKVRGLNEVLDKKSIDYIENVAEEYRQQSVSAQRDFILTLFYLETSKRFRENPAFRGASFKEYLRRKWGMTYANYFDLRRAWTTFEEAAETHGVGTVIDVLKKCGTKKAPAVLKKLDSKAERSGMVRHEDVKKILSEFSEADEDDHLIRKSYTNWEATYKAERIRRLRLEEVVRDQQRQITEAEERIKNLVEHSTNLAAEKGALAAEVDQLRGKVKELEAENEKLRSVFGKVRQIAGLAVAKGSRARAEAGARA